MEQGRILLAVVLSLMVFLVYDRFFAPKPPPQPQQPMQTENLESTETPAAAPRRQPEAEETTVDRQPADTLMQTELPPAVSARSITVETPLYIVEVSESGAVFSSFKLKKYRESAAEDAPLKEVFNLEQPFGEFRLIGESPLLGDLENAVFRADVDSEAVIIESGERSIDFQWVSRSGIRITRQYRFSADSYTIGMAVRIQNAASSELKNPFSIALYQPVGEKTRAYGFEGPSALINNSLEQIEPKKIEKTDPLSGEVTWIGQVDRYFMRALIPESPVQGTLRMRIIDEKVVESKLVPSSEGFSAGSEKRFSYLVFMGPKSVDILADVGHELKRAVDFGWFDFLAKPLLWIMNQIYKVIPNYGIAIILLTIMTKILLWPLGTKSYKSMAEMRKLQPLMTEIREKHKNDKKKMNEEMMGLYRTYKINPMGGCLPMVVQIPFFFALYRMLYEAIELRHAPFFGWIDDLSAPDRLFEFGFSIPFMEAPHGIPVLTLAMGATMFLQQKMSPAPGDPTQAKMMMFMPLIFTVIFINFSSGLVLYWLVNNILSVGQQYIIQKKYA